MLASGVVQRPRVCSLNRAACGTGSRQTGKKYLSGLADCWCRRGKQDRRRTAANFPGPRTAKSSECSAKAESLDLAEQKRMKTNGNRIRLRLRFRLRLRSGDGYAPLLATVPATAGSAMATATA